VVEVHPRLQFPEPVASDISVALAIMTRHMAPASPPSTPTSGLTPPATPADIAPMKAAAVPAI